MRYALEREFVSWINASSSCRATKRRRCQFLISAASSECRGKWGYRWINRYKEVGLEGLLNRSSKPNGCSHETTEAIENEIFALRSKNRGEHVSSRRDWKCSIPRLIGLRQAPSATFLDEPASPVQRGGSGAQHLTLNHSPKSQHRISSGACTSKATSIQATA